MAFIAKNGLTGVMLNNTVHWAPFKKPQEYIAHVMPFLAEGNEG